MNKVILQRWEESERNCGTQPDGCSIHLTEDDRMLFIKNIYNNRLDDVPDSYDRVVGGMITAFIEDGLYSILESKKNLRLQEHEFNNLIKVEELIIKDI